MCSIIIVNCPILDAPLTYSSWNVFMNLEFQEYFSWILSFMNCAFSHIHGLHMIISWLFRLGYTHENTERVWLERMIGNLSVANIWTKNNPIILVAWSYIFALYFNATEVAVCKQFNFLCIFCNDFSPSENGTGVQVPHGDTSKKYKATTTEFSMLMVSLLSLNYTIMMMMMSEWVSEWVSKWVGELN